jgi:hypothetical protein
VAVEARNYREFGMHLKDFLHEFAQAKERRLPLAAMFEKEPPRLAERFEEGNICDAFLAGTADYLSRVNGLHTPGWALHESPRLVNC